MEKLNGIKLLDIISRDTFNQTVLDEYGFTKDLIGKVRTKDFALRIWTYGFEFEDKKGYVFLGCDLEKDQDHWKHWACKLQSDEDRECGWDSPSDLLTMLELECSYRSKYPFI